MDYIRDTKTTAEILEEIGIRLKTVRLQDNQTQSQLAERAGVGVSTLKRAEAGENTSLESLVRILRALDRLDTLDAFLPAPLVSPLQVAERQAKTAKRRRARRG